MASVAPDDDFDDDLDDLDDDLDDDDVVSLPAPAPSTTAVVLPTSTAAAPGAQTTAITQTAATATNPGTTLSTAVSGNNGGTDGNNGGTAGSNGGSAGNNGGTADDNSLITSSSTTVYTTTSGGQVFTVTTAQPVTLTSSENLNRSSGLSTGAKAGIAIGVVIPLLLIAAGLGWFFWRRRKTKRLQARSGGWVGPPYTGAVAEKRDLGSSEMSDATTKAASGGYGGIAELHDKDRYHEAPAEPGYGSVAELHDKDRRIEAPGAPVFEMAAASPAELEGDQQLQQQRDMSVSTPTQSPGGTYSSISPLSPRSVAGSDRGGANSTIDNRASLISPDTASPGNISRKPLR